MQRRRRSDDLYVLWRNGKAEQGLMKRRRRKPGAPDARKVSIEERALRIALLEKHGWHQPIVAEELGIDRSSLGKWMHTNGIKRPPGFVVQKRSSKLDALSVADCQLVCHIIDRLLRGEPIELKDARRARLVALRERLLLGVTNGSETES